MSEITFFDCDSDLFDIRKDFFCRLKSFDSAVLTKLADDASMNLNDNFLIKLLNRKIFIWNISEIETKFLSHAFNKFSARLFWTSCALF